MATTATEFEVKNYTDCSYLGYKTDPYARIVTTWLVAGTPTSTGGNIIICGVDFPIIDNDPSLSSVSGIAESIGTNASLANALLQKGYMLSYVVGSSFTITTNFSSTYASTIQNESIPGITFVGTNRPSSSNTNFFTIKGAEAIKNVIKMYLMSNKGDYGRNITKGGPLFEVIGKPVNDNRQEKLDKLIRDAIQIYSNIVVNKITINKDTDNKGWIISILFSDTYNKFIDQISLAIVTQ
jgi:phage baseplate assembly protein W